MLTYSTDTNKGISNIKGSLTKGKISILEKQLINNMLSTMHNGNSEWFTPIPTALSYTSQSAGVFTIKVAE